MVMLTKHEGTSALVLDSPHSGTVYPPDFRFACEALALRQAEDTHVEKLYADAPELGASWLEAHFPRSYLDANRDVVEIDPDMLDGPWPHPLPEDPRVRAKVRLGKGLIWRHLDDGTPIYQRRLSVDEVQARIARCWQPYHQTLQALLDAAHARHGWVIHLNCHSMPAVASAYATDHPGLAHADFVVGNRDHSTSSPGLADWLVQFLRERAYDVALNHPYKGVELVRRYGRPAEHRHSLQLEINRRLYMDEQTLQPHEGFERLRGHLREMVQALSGLDPRSL